MRRGWCSCTILRDEASWLEDTLALFGSNSLQSLHYLSVCWEVTGGSRGAVCAFSTTGRSSHATITGYVSSILTREMRIYNGLHQSWRLYLPYCYTPGPFPRICHERPESFPVRGYATLRDRVHVSQACRYQDHSPNRPSTRCAN